MKNRIVLLGPPASGKGTQAALLSATFGIAAASTGAMLREEKARGSELGAEAERWTIKESSSLTSWRCASSGNGWMVAGDLSWTDSRGLSARPRHSTKASKNAVCRSTSSIFSSFPTNWSASA